MANKDEEDGLSAERQRALAVLTGNDPGLRQGRRLFAKLPGDPRCKLCYAPFSVPVGPLMKLLGKGPWPKNPKYCSACFVPLVKYRIGAEIECTLLFADVRGSTAMAEQMRPQEFTRLMNRFFDSAGRLLVHSDAIVDKFVGDAVMAIFVPALTGEQHSMSAITAGRGLLEWAATQNDDAPLPVGVGVNAGVAYVGAVGEGDNVDLTAMGDPVNVAARLASAAGPGEMLVSVATVRLAGLSDTGMEHRRLDLKGKSGTVEVVVLRAGDV